MISPAPGFFEPRTCGKQNSRRFLVIVQAFNIAWPIVIGKFLNRAASATRGGRHKGRTCYLNDAYSLLARSR